MRKKIHLASFLSAWVLASSAHAVEIKRLNVDGLMRQMASGAGLSVPDAPAARPADPRGLAAFEMEYTYQASERDSKLACREASMALLKRKVIEELGMAVISVYEEQRSTRGKADKEEAFRLVKDQIVIASGGSVKAEILQENWDGRTYWIKARLQADPAEIKRNVDGFLAAWRKRELDPRDLTMGDRQPGLFPFAAAQQAFYIHDGSRAGNAIGPNRLAGLWLLVGRAENGENGAYDPAHPSGDESLEFDATANKFLASGINQQVIIRTNHAAGGKPSPKGAFAFSFFDIWNSSADGNPSSATQIRFTAASNGSTESYRCRIFDSVRLICSVKIEGNSSSTYRAFVKRGPS